MRPFGLAVSTARGALSRMQNVTTTTATATTTTTIGSGSSRALVAKRPFSSFPQLRPSILPSSSSSSATSTSTVFRPANGTLLSRLANCVPETTSSGATAAPDLVPRSAISAHPALAGAGVQIRCGPRPTMARSSRLVRKRRHGFLSRLRTRNGRKTLQRRKDKKRSVLSM